MHSRPPVKSTNPVPADNDDRAHAWPVSPLPFWSQALGILLACRQEFQIRGVMGFVYHKYNEAHRYNRFAYPLPARASEDVVLGTGGSTARRAVDDVFGTFSNPKIFPHDSQLLGDEWVANGLAEYKFMDYGKQTTAQLVEAVHSRSGPESHTFDTTTAPFPSLEDQISKRSESSIIDRSIFPHTPIFGISFVGDTFRRVVAIGNELYIDIDPQSAKGEITGASHWKSLRYKSSQLKIDQTMFLIARAAKRIDDAINLSESAPLEGEIVADARFKHRLMRSLDSLDSNTRGTVPVTEDQNGFQSPQSKSGESMQATQPSSGNSSSGRNKSTLVTSVFKEFWVYKPSDDKPYVRPSSSSGRDSEEEAEEEEPLSEFQEKLLQTLKPMSSMPAHRQLQLFGFMGTNALEVARDYISF